MLRSRLCVTALRCLSCSRLLFLLLCLAFQRGAPLHKLLQRVRSHILRILVQLDIRIGLLRHNASEDGLSENDLSEELELGVFLHSAWVLYLSVGSETAAASPRVAGCCRRGPAECLDARHPHDKKKDLVHSPFLHEHNH
ncbi:hypothetical protein EDD22DRAFT_871902, partial [Suillus occidentalis]